jgi:hypothetical protein
MTTQFTFSGKIALRNSAPTKPDRFGHFWDNTRPNCFSAGAQSVAFERAED